ncbi:hypothetical protein [Acinetobacter baumannii]|uniref:hypothetical protein n=1 Tax=Acinetobacter baumannii TaxID=470 RepID=UPI001C0C9030|nr:hypothetical protein [Acinetobacter baumannii]MBU3081225.1 hypothetical protein [Acinetobacter baumannii]MDC4427979.1 hypothetical protein [Acinetobacter baumannii]MDC5144889.1 hypothetical protein [Acinetobacter baumannii]
MVVESFKPCSADSLVNQLNTGLTYISNPFQITEPTRHFDRKAVEQAVAHFKDSNVEVGVLNKGGWTVITAKIN